MPKRVAAELEKTVLVPSGFRLAVIGPADKRPTIHTICAPFVLIGSARNCGLRLDQPGVKRRHLLLQTILGRLFCIDLSGPGEDLWQAGSHAAAWLEPDQPIQAGPYEIRLVDAVDAKDEEGALPAGFSPLDRYAGQLGPMPKVRLDFFKGGTHQTSSFVNRLIVLGGSSSACKLRLQDPSVSSIHFSLILAQDGLWSADLAGRNGIAVNDRPVSYEKLNDRDELHVGTFVLRVHYAEESRGLVPANSTAEIDLGADTVAVARKTDEARAAADASLAEAWAEIDRQRLAIESRGQELAAQSDALEKERTSIAESLLDVEALRAAAKQSSKPNATGCRPRRMPSESRFPLFATSWKRRRPGFVPSDRVWRKPKLSSPSSRTLDLRSSRNRRPSPQSGTTWKKSEPKLPPMRRNWQRNKRR